MESKTTRNSVILRNIDSPFIEQAIFILKNGTDEAFSDDIVDEAQKIIDNFLKRRRNLKQKQMRIKAALFCTPVFAAAGFFLFLLSKILL